MTGASGLAVPTLVGDRPDAVEVALGGDREAGLDDVDPQARELLGDLQLLGDVQEMPGACSPSRRVVSKMRTGVVVLSFTLGILLVTRWGHPAIDSAGGVDATSPPRGVKG